MLWQKKYIFVLLYFACAKIAKKTISVIVFIFSNNICWQKIVYWWE